MNYKKYSAVVLKKQNYKEADQILTLWTREAGKVRVLAKSIRMPKSKLAYAVGDLSLTEIDVAGRGLPVLIGAKPVRSFNSVRQDLQKMIIGLRAAELILKMTADEHPNPVAFDLLAEFLQQLDVTDYSSRYHPLLECFSLDLLETLGFKMPQNVNTKQILEMNSDQIEEIHSTINQFIEYILERPIWMIKF